MPIPVASYSIPYLPNIASISVLSFLSILLGLTRRPSRMMRDILPLLLTKFGSLIKVPPKGFVASLAYGLSKIGDNWGQSHAYYRTDCSCMDVNRVIGLGTKQQRHIVTMASRNMNDWRGTISGLNVLYLQQYINALKAKCQSRVGIRCLANNRGAAPDSPCKTNGFSSNRAGTIDKTFLKTLN
ncbi:Short-chain dehydrogenase/reductase tropE [Fusarium oxysporum f. sp. albedinis]|nr:Short-chain dehydrogenase/reductase tropE [Fusarium oxysporum f. sp. albedinis]